MATTRVNQEQLEKSLTYDDTITPSLANYETTPVDVEDDFNSLRSQVQNILNRDGVSFPTGNWYDNINTTTSGKSRGVSALNTDLAFIEEKKVLCRAQVLTDVSVTASQNWEILSVAGSEAPTHVAARVSTTNGAVVAISAFSGAGFNVHELVEVAGANAISPKNLVLVRDSTTFQPIQSGGRDIYGLLQNESTGTDGAAFNDTSGGNRVKISFVRTNTAGNDLEACPVADIAGKTINYSYVFRTDFENVDEDCFLANGTFTDLTASTDVTRQNAYTNQGTTIVTTSANATVDLGLTFLWEIGDNASATLFRVTEGSGAGTSTVLLGSDVDVYDNNAVDVNFNNGIQVDVGSNTINIGITADQIDFTGNAVVTSGSGSTVTVRSTAANLNLNTVTSGNVVSSSAGAWDLDASTGITIDSATAGVSIDGVTASNFTVTGGDLVLSTVTSGELDMTSAGLMDVNAGANLDIDVTGTYDMLSTGAFSIDGTGASNVSVASGNLTVSTTTTGNLSLEGAVNVDVVSGTGDIDITAGTSVDIVSGSTSDITATAGRNILLTSDVAEFDVSIQDVGHWLDRADFHYFGDTNRGDNYLTVNAQYVSSTATTGGMVKVTSAATVTGGTITASTAGVAATSNPTLTTSGSTGLAAGTIIIVEGATPRSLNGIYEINGTVTTTVTLRGVGTSDTVEDFTKRQVETDAAASGTIYIVTVCVIRCSTTGVWQVASGSSTPLTFTTLSTGTSTLQQVYEAGNTISVSSAEGIITFSNSTDATNVLEISRTFAGAGVGIDLNMGATTTGIAFDVDITAGATGNAVDVLNAGSGDAFFLNNTGTGAAFTVQDGGSDVLDVAATGAVTVTPTGGTNFTATVAGAGVVDINAGSGGVTVDAVSGAISLDAGAASNFTVTSAALTLETVTSGNVNVTAATNVDVDGTSVLVDATSAVSIDAAAASNFSTSAGTLTVSNSSATATDDVAVSANAGDVDITSTSGNTSCTATGGQHTHSTQNTRISITNTSATGATAPGVVLANSWRNYFQSGTQGDLFLTFGTAYTSTTGTTNGQVYVVSTSTATADTVAGAGFTAGVSATSNATVGTTGAATFSAGDLVLISHEGGGTRRENLGLFEVHTHAANVLTVRGMLTAITAGAEWASRNFRTDATTGATIRLATLSVFRVNATGQAQIAESFTNSTGILYQDIGSSGVTLANVVTNQGGTAFTAGAFDTQWGISNSQFLEFGDAANVGILTIRGDSNAEAITGLGGNTSAGAGQTVSFTGGTATTSGQAGGAVTYSGGAGLGAGAGGNSTVVAGAGGATGAGGDAFVTGGNGGATSGDAGDVTVAGGTPTDGNGGNISVTGSAGVGTNRAGGSIAVTTGDATGTAGAGSFSVTAGQSVTGSAGDVSISAGAGGSTSGAGGTVAVSGGAGTAGNSAGGAVSVTSGQGQGTASGGTMTVAAGTGGATGAGAAATLRGGHGGATSGAAGSCSITGGTPVDGNGGAVTVTASAGVGTNRAGGGVTVTAGASTGSGSAGSITATAGTPASGAGSAGLLDFDAGTGGAGTAGASPQNASAGGAASFTAGAGGAADGGAAASQGADGGAGGLAGIVGGLGGAGEQGVDPGAAGTGGAALIGGGIGGAGAGTSTGGETAADGATGGAVSVSGGRGGNGASGTVDPAAAGTGGAVNIVGGVAGTGAGTGDNGSGGEVNITGGAADNTGSGAAGTAGIVSLRTPSGPSTTITQAATVVRFNNQGSGTGGGQVMDLFTGTAAPTHTASTGSLFLYDDATTGRAYVNESSGGSGTTWSRVQTASSTVSRNFFQDTLATTVSPGSTITAASLTGGVIAVKPSSGFSFNIDAQIFLNGIHLMNGSGNEVTSGAGNGVTIESGGPTFRTGDVITIIYHTNSTNNTA